jgi:RNA polymerase sigma-70 factor, ECF subfamily
VSAVAESLPPDMPSFRDVYATHFRFVWRVLRRLGVSDADASDAAQDVFVVVHRRLSEYEPRAKMSTWIFAICARVAQARRRKKRVDLRRLEKMSLDGKELELRALDTAVPSDTLYENRENALLLETVLKEIPAEQRTVFILAEIEELDGVEIADALGIALGTMRSRLRLGREAFERACVRQQAKDEALQR